MIRIYDDMMAIERREFGAGGRLGEDWIMPLDKHEAHPLSHGELKKVIGEPQFREGATLELAAVQETPGTDDTKGLDDAGAGRSIKLSIPLADGNPKCRAYAYEVEVKGDAASPSLLRATYAAGINMGIGHETNGGVSTIDIPVSDLPDGETVAFSATPLSSLGTRGTPLTLSKKRHRKDKTEP